MEMLRRFIEDAPIGAAMFDRDMRYIAYSARWLLDHRIDAIPLGESHYVVFPEIPDRWREVHRRALAGEVLREAEDRFDRADGSFVWLRWEVRPWRYDEAAVGGIIIFTEDITPQKNAEEALQEAESRQRLAQSAGRIGIWDWDVRKGHTWLNDEWRELYGLPKGAALTYDDFLARVHPADRPAVDKVTQAALAGNGVIDMDFRILRADTGALRWVSSKGEVHFDAGGRPLRAMGAVYDITDRKEMERELLELDRRKSEFLATLGHELRNPLTPIKNAIGVLQRLSQTEPPDEKKAAILEMARRQVDYLVHLVNDLLDMNRISFGKIRVRKEKTDLARLIRDAVDLCRADLEAKRQHLTLDLPGELALDGDPVRLTQVFANLLSNAARYTDHGGRIEIRGRREGGDVVATVRDDGAGIPRDLLTSVFDMFAQGAHGAEGAQQGLGVGLALARVLVEMHNGHIEARSEGAGKGAEFVVRLPAA